MQIVTLVSRRFVLRLCNVENFEWKQVETCISQEKFNTKERADNAGVIKVETRSFTRSVLQDQFLKFCNKSEEVISADMAAKRGVKRKVKEEKENVKKAIKKEPVKIKKEEVSDFSDHEMDEYEQQRLKNIADRKNKFDELKLNEISADVSFEYVKPKKTASRRGLSAPNSNKEKAPLEPMRKSLRLQRIDADTGVTLPDKEPTRYHIVEYDEPQRPPIKDLTLEELCNNNEDWESTSKYFNDMIKPHLDQDNKKSVLSSSCFSDISKIAKGIKSLKITVSVFQFLSLNLFNL